MITRRIIKGILVVFSKKARRRNKYMRCGISIGNINMVDVDTYIEAPSLLENVYTGKNVSIGKYSYIVKGDVYSNVKIGKFVSIAINVVIGALEHPTDWLSTNSFQYSIDNIFDPGVTYNEDITTIIGNDVWIGANTFIKRGVTVGHGAIIAAGAVVTHDVPPYSIVGGVPAKLIRYRFESNIIDRLLLTEWWDIDIEHLKGLTYSNITQALCEIEAIKKI